MKTHQPKLPRHLFSCGFFRHCTQTIPSPTTPTSPPLPPPQLLPSPPPPSQQSPPPPPPPPPPLRHSSSSSSTTSSSSTSQSFTQWRFPTPISQQSHHPTPPDQPPPQHNSTLDLQDLFHLSTLQLASGSDSDSLAALHSLETHLVPNPQPDPVCPPDLIRGVVRMLSHPPATKSATKILLALCLADLNRRAAVEVGAVGEVMEAVAAMERATAERALAALELLCTVAEGAAELRSHALAVPMMVEMMGRMEGHRGKEYAMSVLAVIYSKDIEMVAAAPPEEVARAVALAMQGECSARGRRKGSLLLKILKEIDQRPDMIQDV
ncbi:unnamed protein product [Rhodiola kirilowii]